MPTANRRPEPADLHRLAAALARVLESAYRRKAAEPPEPPAA
jgi:hypothetical protein